MRVGMPATAAATAVLLALTAFISYPQDPTSPVLPSLISEQYELRGLNKLSPSRSAWRLILSCGESGTSRAKKAIADGLGRCPLTPDDTPSGSQITFRRIK